jgi:Zn-finger nucleic acid-binding protein
MRCSKCQSQNMVRETYAEVDIDRCPFCKGMYLDKGEAASLIKSGAGSDADTMAYSPISDMMDGVAAMCGRCGVPMQAMAGPGEVRIDRCPQCFGIFLDEGELLAIQLAMSPGLDIGT